MDHSYTDEWELNPYSFRHQWTGKICKLKRSKALRMSSVDTTQMHASCHLSWPKHIPWATKFASRGLQLPCCCSMHDSVLLTLCAFLKLITLYLIRQFCFMNLHNNPKLKSTWIKWLTWDRTNYLAGIIASISWFWVRVSLKENGQSLSVPELAVKV